MFYATWEIRTNVSVDSRIVCQGPYPNDLKSVPDLIDRLNHAITMETDADVKRVMGEWAK